MVVRSPQGDAEFERYYQLRWEVLRKPWGEPRGSECDEFDAPDGGAEHALLIDEHGVAMAVGRLHFNAPDEAQIRYMAVRESLRGQGLGRQIVDYLEGKARERGAKHVVLNARDTVVQFYEGLGYQTVGAGPVLFKTVRHVRMQKAL